MKKAIIAIITISLLMLSGCQSPCNCGYADNASAVECAENSDTTMG